MGLNHVMNTNPTDTACITPQDDGTVDVMIYRMLPAGICGPFTSTKTVAADEVDAQIARFGFVRTGEFGPLCANGFAEAPVVAA